MKVAFYKAEGNWQDKLIRLWTRGKYSHCEIVDGNVWYSSSPRDGGVRAKYMDDWDENSWDFIEVEADHDRLIEVYAKYEYAKYDWLGIILTQFIPLGIENEKKVFCSEFCAIVLDLYGAKWLSPNALYKNLQK